ncbi:MAG: amidohydrolase family protein [Acidimicrobiia bacterium]
MNDRDPGLPIHFGPCSNGEYQPEPLGPVVGEALAEARAACDDHARRSGLSRREFLQSACAAATTLAVLDSLWGRALGAPAGGRYHIPPEATLDPQAAAWVVGGDEFVFDVQGHLLDYDLNPAIRDAWFWGRQFPQADCGEDDPRACFSMGHFLEEMFIRSDTTMVALSGLPILPEGSPLPVEVMDETRRVVEALGRHQRVVINALVLPQLGPLPPVLEEMERTTDAFPVAGWKTFTHFPSAWRLDDADPHLPQVGEAFLAQVARLGRPILLVHKGLSGGSPHSSPADVGPAARRHPEISFIVYHSGFEAGMPEGPYTPATAHRGVNRLITSLREAGVGSGQNVYAELGSTWWHLMRSPDQAAHLLGKLILHLGADNVLWGTDSIFYGSPQGQIQAFRAFQIGEQLQERWGYPRLTRSIKRKILGGNAARLFGVDPVTVPLDFDPAELEEVRRTLPVPNRTYGPRTPAEVRAFRAHHRGWP